MVSAQIVAIMLVLVINLVLASCLALAGNLVSPRLILFLLLLLLLLFL